MRDPLILSGVSWIALLASLVVPALLGESNLFTSMAILISASIALYGLLWVVRHRVVDGAVGARDIFGALLCMFALAFVLALVAAFAGLFNSV